MMSTGRRSTRAAALTAVSLALLSIAVSTSVDAAKRVALVIGNSAYQEAPLRNPVNDARAMAATLEGLGFEVMKLENATKAQIERAIVQFAGRLDDDSSGLFYYAGHGVQIRGRNYLVPVGTRFQSQREARIESVGVDMVLDELAYAGNRLNIVILDACRNNPFERRLRGASRGLAAIDAARGTLIAYATSPGSVALDGQGGNGLYTEELLRALGRPGLQIEEVFKQVRIGVARRTNDQQIPWESSSLTGSFVFNRVAMNASVATLTKRRSETVFWESVERIGTVGAYRAYLERYPDGVFATLAFIRIAELEVSKPATTGEQPAMLAKKSQASPLTAADPTPDKKLIAILPAEGIDTSCTGAAHFNVDDTMVTLENAMRDAGLSANRYRYLGWDSDAEPGDLWRSEGIRKEPVPELVYEHGDGLAVDGMLLVWFEHFGTNTCRVNYALYLFDVRLKKLYKNRATDYSLESAADDLAAQFVQEHGLVQKTR